MTTQCAFIHIAIGNEIRPLVEPVLEWLRSEALPPVTVVICSDSADLRDQFASLSQVSLIAIKSSPSLLSAVAKRSGEWTTVNLDANAPRLREVRLPAKLVHASSVLSIVDNRSSGLDRPDFGIALWSHLAQTHLRLGARVTGRREGLTAEIALARPPDRIVCIDQLWKSGPFALVSGSDLIASEVIALSLRDLRTARASEHGGPWEDDLVQRATELGLGVPGPAHIAASATIDGRCMPGDRERAIEAVVLAVTRAGIDEVFWQ